VGPIRALAGNNQAAGNRREVAALGPAALDAAADWREVAALELVASIDAKPPPIGVDPKM
jgi:hypothetical protein